MKSLLIIIDSLEKWTPYYRSESIITADHYLQHDGFDQHSHMVINLCSDLSYQSEGYYCSLLAQARNHKILPSIEALNRLDDNIMIKIDQSLLPRCTCQAIASSSPEDKEYSFDLFFGKCEDPKLQKLGRFIFDHYTVPLLRVNIKGSQPFHITKIRNLSLDELDNHQQDIFAQHLDGFNKKVWRKPRTKKPTRYDLAILHNPEEQFPPSNKKAINMFLNEAKKMGINAELITEDDSSRLMEFDALFIRQTTAVNNITYKLAHKAEQADMVVIDDPSSIIRCTNKVYLKEFLENSSIPAPRSKLIFRNKPYSYPQIAETLGNTMVLKIPDGSFSVGVEKISNAEEYGNELENLFRHSSILLAQEFIPTDYDWRIGLLNGECIYACKYFMARGHWQIYHHKTGLLTKSGGVETVPVHTVPRQIIRVANKATTPIGRGLYGVDIKVVGDQALVIEVNDNPSIDHGVEDKILGRELYRMILREFTRRLATKRRG
ncbi:RimK family protein [Desulfopila sp. IMCC35008]|uniref:RimK family protein n=1 Tax=Desulfopila sp. IMCC35008 TaxID=2653858 RepID=UPI0013CF7CEF|nr:RimK family protein [Desulfopila sp. IMCC35008]